MVIAKKKFIITKVEAKNPKAEIGIISENPVAKKAIAVVREVVVIDLAAFLHV